MSTENNDELKTQTGIVGFFDILGYTSLLEKNTADNTPSQEVLTEVYNIIKEVPKQTEKSVSLAYKSIEEPTMHKFLSNIKWLIFSDTILITMEFDPTDGIIEADSRLPVLLTLIAIFTKNMFESGLPVRGVMDYGQYIVNENINFFAGKPIIDAYKLCNKINLAACCISPNLTNEINKLTAILEDHPTIGVTEQDTLKRRKKLHDHILVEYMVPYKDGSDKLLSTINNLYRKKDLPQDVRQYVLESCWKHNKDLRQSDMSKADKTEQFIRFLITHEKKILEKK